METAVSHLEDQLRYYKEYLKKLPIGSRKFKRTQGIIIKLTEKIDKIVNEL